MRESGPLCDCAVCFFQLCSESSQSRAFSAPHFAKGWLLHLHGDEEEEEHVEHEQKGLG